jgi:Uma2 family endonuclease
MVALRTVQRKRVVLRAADNGRRMSLDDFDRAEISDGLIYELNKGMVEVSNVPALWHGKVVRYLRKQLERYDDAHAGVISYTAGGSESKLLIEAVESERHPDWTVYLRPEPPGEDQPWSVWVPEIVIEVVSDTSRKRDYEDKPPEYLALGIAEYWIVDRLAGTVTHKTRWRGVWKDKVLKPGQSLTTHLLPGFKLDIRKALNAGK